MNWSQTSVKVTKSIIEHPLELDLIYLSNSNTLNSFFSFLHIRLMVLSHGRSCNICLHCSHLKISSKSFEYGHISINIVIIMYPSHVYEFLHTLTSLNVTSL